jgi:protein tyrosine phosphatase
MASDPLAKSEFLFIEDLHRTATRCKSFTLCLENPHNALKLNSRSYPTDNRTCVGLKRDNSFIPASFVTSVSNKKFIISQKFKPEYAGDFWRMLFEQSCGLWIDILVSGDTLDVPDVQTFTSDPNMKVYCVANVSVRSTLHIKYLYIEDIASNETKMVTLIQFIWTGLAQKISIELIYLLKMLYAERQDSTIVIQDLNGSGRSGILMVIYEYIYRNTFNVVNKINVYEVVVPMILCRTYAIKTIVEYNAIFTILELLHKIYSLRSNYRMIAPDIKIKC